MTSPSEASLIEQIHADPEEEPTIVLLRDDLRRLVREVIDHGAEGHREVKYMVDQYYSIQENRIRAAHRMRKLKEANLPIGMLAWTHAKEVETERYIKSFLEYFAREEPTGMGRWAMGIYGIGPVIATGLLANVNIERTPTASNLWAFAGLDPTKKWEKGQLRPWSASLKQVCYKIGDSFMKFHNRPDCFYGKLYSKFKAEIAEMNEAGTYAEQAEGYLAAKKFGRETSSFKCYTEGKLPPLQVELRARRRAVKIFLSHWWEEAYHKHYGVRPPAAYPIDILGHAHIVPPPLRKVPKNAKELRDSKKAKP